MSDDELVWPVKESFVRYIRGMADGVCAAEAGAREIRPGAFAFEAAPSTQGDPADPVLRFRGTLRFSGHHGMLALALADPWLVPGEAGWSVTLLDGGREVDRGRRRVVAEGGHGDPRSHEVVARLSDWGALLFHDAYAVGTALDPFSLRPAGGAD